MTSQRGARGGTLGEQSGEQGNTLGEHSENRQGNRGTLSGNTRGTHLGNSQGNTLNTTLEMILKNLTESVPLCLTTARHLFHSRLAGRLGHCLVAG